LLQRTIPVQDSGCLDNPLTRGISAVCAKLRRITDVHPQYPRTLFSYRNQRDGSLAR
jgi:hypothetical protein